MSQMLPLTGAVIGSGLAAALRQPDSSVEDHTGSGKSLSLLTVAGLATSTEY